MCLVFEASKNADGELTNAKGELMDANRRFFGAKGGRRFVGAESELDDAGGESLDNDKDEGQLIHAEEALNEADWQFRDVWLELMVVREE